MKNFSTCQAVRVVVVVQLKVREGRGEQKGRSQGEFIDYTRSPSLLEKLHIGVLKRLS